MSAKTNWQTGEQVTATSQNELGVQVNLRIPSTEKGANNGVATLGSDGKIPAGQIVQRVPDPSAEPDNRWLRTSSGTLVYGEKPAPSPFVRETSGTYGSRPTVADLPNAIWIGTSDATLLADFVQWNATTGVGDTWQQVPSE